MPGKIDLERLLEQSEGEKFDLKLRLDLSTTEQKSKFIKDIVSMANTVGEEPAYIVIGVQEKPRKCVGVTEHPDDAMLQELVKDKVSPVPDFWYRTVSHAGLSFGVIEVHPGPRLHQITRDYGVLRKLAFYLRRGSSNQEPDGAEIERLVLERSHRALTAALQEQAWARGIQLKPRAAGAWSPQHVFSGFVRQDSGNPSVGAGDWLAVSFEPDPSEVWSDPYVAEVHGFFHEKTKEVSPLQMPLVVRGPDGTEKKASHRRLCIPSYDVDVEWRDEAYLADPLWGAAKRFMVRRFLLACGGAKMLCRVVYVGFPRQGVALHLNSPDYDDYLVKQWSVVKGIENALAKSKIFKRSAVSDASEEQLRVIVENDLLAQGLVMKMMPQRFCEVETPDAELVLLVLRGLIRRYRTKSTKPFRSRNLK